MNKLFVAVAGLSVLIGASPFIADEVLVKEQSFSFDANASSVDRSGNYTKNIGIVTNSNMDFGELPVGMGVTKFLNISMPRKGIVDLGAEGNISDSLDIREYHYFEGRKEIRVRFNASEEGYYTGNVTLKTQVPKHGIGNTWLGIKYFFYRL